MDKFHELWQLVGAVRVARLTVLRRIERSVPDCAKEFELRTLRLGFLNYRSLSSSVGTFTARS
jgi:cob(I)alamin adenosyltransferase